MVSDRYRGIPFNTPIIHGGPIVVTPIVYPFFTNVVALWQPFTCPKCGSTDVVIATADNGFGGWKCNACNGAGCYPPN